MAVPDFFFASFSAARTDLYEGIFSCHSKLAIEAVDIQCMLKFYMGDFVVIIRRETFRLRKFRGFQRF